MKNESYEKGFIEERIESCREIEQELAIPKFNRWLKDVGLWDNNQSAWSEIHFMTDKLNLYNEVHKYKFCLHDNKVLHFWFVGSSGEVDFREIGINEILCAILTLSVGMFRRSAISSTVGSLPKS